MKAVDDRAHLVDVDKLLAECARAMGAEVADDSISDRKALNADYFFVRHRVVAELKCLEKDYWGDQAFKERVSAMYASWVARGLVRPRAGGRFHVQLGNLPKTCQQEFIARLRNKLASGVKQANRQIRSVMESKDALDASGVLILVNDGNPSLSPPMVRFLLSSLLNNHNRAISMVIHLSTNMFVTAPSVGRPVLFWAPWEIPNRQPVTEGFVEELRENYFRLLSADGAVGEIHTDDNAMLEDLQYTRAYFKPV
ncbi:hypothetical protein H4W19_03785 [Pseudoxanthomonas mexicana]|uniref:Uncharacterized protein n=1 Tax=Pseudoxanthomonas mexicana TaxID=128785 RepID=A0ABX6RCM9_PSEMX|nr:hypothetical protein [Pseudoxanthomonas mexicana]QND80927.1 hypothetical protein H4W19_03785 [Pseudoxanthomonas mexicana]